jgi:Domain of unknown function (DUF4336)
MSLTCLVPDQLWCAQQALKFGPITISTRMTVVRLTDGSLWIHSPISPSQSLVDSVHALGKVSFVVAPNKSHHLFFLDYLKAFPSALGFIAPGLAVKRPDLARFGTIPDKAPWSADLQGYFIKGLPIIDETVWFHSRTGSLIVTDLLFCFSRSHRGFAALISQLLGVRGTLGMSRTMRLAIKNKMLFTESVRPLLSLPVQRVILAHDQVIEEDAARKLRQAFAWLK